MPLYNVTISTILAEKGAVVHTIPHDASVHEAVVKMNHERVGSILVMQDEKVVGIFTERDVLTRIVETGRDPAKTPVSEVMSSDIQRISPETSIEEAMERITDRRARHLPVFDKEEKLIGLVSIGDVLRWLIKLNQMETDNLKQYIFGEYTD